MARFIILLLCGCFVGGGGAEARGRKNPEIVSSGVAREIVDGDTLILEGGTQIRLVGIQGPKLPLGRPNFRKWPLADQAKAALRELALGKTLDLKYGGRRIDRHGRLLAHLHDANGGWIQGELVRRGLARVYTFRDNRWRAAELLALEREARAARRGIWAHPYYRVLRDSETGRFIDTFQLVEGRVLDAAVVRRRAYLNFGTDWRSDFTITIAARGRALFKRAGLTIAGFKGKRVRVRGWLRYFNGPMIEATHPEQIELLGE